MHRTLRPRILATATLVGALGAGLAPSQPAIAMDPLVGTTMPGDPVTFVFPRPAMQAMTFDIDGDGVRELVTVGVSSHDADLAAVQVWWVDEDGQPTGSNELSLRGFDGERIAPAQVSDGAAPFIARRAGKPHLFVAVEAMPDDDTDPCCLTIFEVTLESERAIALTQVADTRRLATQLAIADLDGDGTDELMVIEGPWSWEGDVAPPVASALLQWDGSRFARGALDLGVSGCCTSLDAVGNTDGHPGDDIHLTAYEEDGSAQRSLRVTLRDGEPTIEVASDEPAMGGPRLVPLGGGEALLTINESSAAELWRWPRDQAKELLASRPTSCGNVAVLGSGRSARILSFSCTFPTNAVRVMPADLGELTDEPVEFPTDGRAASLPESLQQTMFPWEGRIPDGLPGISDAYLFSGQLVFPVADPEQLAGVQRVSLMVGTRPVGRVGPDGDWEVLALNDNEGHYDQNSAREFVWIPGQPAPGTLRMVPAGALLGPEALGSNLRPTFYGAAADPASTSRLLAGVVAVDAELHGPPGTVVRWLVPSDPEGRSEIGPTGALSIPILPEDAERNVHSGTIRISAVTPAGNVYWGQWSIRVVVTPPELEVTVPDELVEPEPVIRGRTSPGAAVTVNGVAADVLASGFFRIRVDPGIVPTEFRIVASDPVDNMTMQVVSLVWPVDYRRLPFIPIVFLVTVAAGIVLFVRRPVGGDHAIAQDGDATIEEIGG